MEFKGTKGSWRIASKKFESQFYVIHGFDSENSSREHQVCCINYGAHPIKEQLNKTQANAKLIASAPDLLELCLLVYNSFGGGNVITFSKKDIEDFKQAIEKALK